MWSTYPREWRPSSYLHKAAGACDYSLYFDGTGWKQCRSALWLSSIFSRRTFFIPSPYISDHTSGIWTNNGNLFGMTCKAWPRLLGKASKHALISWEHL